MPGPLIITALLLVSSGVLVQAAIDQEIQSVDQKLLHKVDQIFEILLGMKNSQSAMEKEIQQVAADLNHLRLRQKEAEILFQQESNRISEKLATVRTELLDSGEKTRNMVANGTAQVVSGLQESNCDEARSDSTDLEREATEMPTEYHAPQPVSKSNFTCGKLKEIDLDDVLRGKYGMYTIYEEALTWDESKKYCESNSMQLATLDSAEKINDILQKVKKDSDGYGVWLSANNGDRGNAQFHWPDGTPVAASLWGPGFPKDFQRVARSCAWLSANGKIFDYFCAGKSRPFCQLPSEAAVCF